MRTCLGRGIIIVKFQFHLPIVGIVVTTIVVTRRKKTIALRVLLDNVSNSTFQPRLHTFTELQFVKDGSFTSSIETDHKDSHLLLAELLGLKLKATFQRMVSCCSATCFHGGAK